METEKRICSFCNKAMPPIGNKRQNGKLNRNDWDHRKYHIKCYKNHCELNEFMKNMNAKYGTNVVIKPNI